MKGHHKHLIGYIFISFFVLFANFFISLTTVKAEPVGLPLNDYMVIDTPTIINPPNGTNYFNKNTASIQNEDTAKLTDKAGQIVKEGGLLVKNLYTLNRGTMGAIWSKDSDTWDLSQVQQISAWMNFGPPDDSSLVNGEGLAFVIQNDNRGTKAIGTGLQGLGVYGYDLTTFPSASPTPPSPELVTLTAVKNSVAIEFDTNLNKAGEGKVPTLIHYKDLLIDKSEEHYTSNGFDSDIGIAGSTGVNLLPNSYLGLKIPGERG